MSLSDFVGGMFFTIVGVLFQVFIDKFKNAQKFINYVSIAALSIGMFWLGLEIGTMGSFEPLNDRKSVGLSVPMSNWKVNGETIGSSILGDDSRSGEFELSSVQAENFFTIPEKQIIYSWDSPGAFPELNRVPLRGIQSVILISPLETKYEIERVFCHYTVRYAGVSYISIEQYIPFNQRTLMLWDFNGKISPSDIGMSGEDLISLESGATLLQKKGVSLPTTQEDLVSCGNGKAWSEITMIQILSRKSHSLVTFRLHRIIVAETLGTDLPSGENLILVMYL